ncbi:MAG TPA: ribonuclease J [Syntrophothermus lipocalidus]|uniref:Ribonuclease J n=1 Tax=Syntrophothermus lipocalidus (strain DSM 12680 / TGB-C1) TaxID=643648 RepID=D7CM71_SYNLT|nr:MULTISPECIES: ribonuclease J [Syntrophothermus]ADI01806.1 RNA-metabolising metallo-beta-lactamase [Syntrophothermus lipocalidus DSM 12680]NSW83695.1 ribonuclease J [Syntrophothermus sp.]HHV77204.1 ribonuclease J [Syntrophothermus lipocalidus]
MLIELDRIYVIPLGGLGEIGKNMMLVRYQDNIVVIDAGLMFPEEELLGIDIVIPDMTYLFENRDKVKAVLVTHGHEDHVGALPYLLREIDVPIYGTKLTIGIIEAKLREHGLTGARLNIVKPRDKINVGPLEAEFIRVSHSIPDTLAIAIHSPVGTILHTGDFKLDQTPVDGEVVDFRKFAELGEKGVLLMLSDSTNAERPGYTMSERVVGNTFDELFGRCEGRIIITTFASNVHRIQQAINTACKYNRKVAVVGRSMINNVNIARELGYIAIPEGTLVDVELINRYPDNQLVIVTTGSQGEPMSALTRMATAEHRWVSIQPGDTVIISATPIPGNEKLVARTIDMLYKQGAEVVYGPATGVHVSGHASQEELKIMVNLIRPRYFIPIHGEYRHLKKHARLAENLGIPRSRIFVVENGQVIEVGRKKAGVIGKVTSGRVLVDGLGVGDVGNIVLRDRKQLSSDGIIIVVVTINKETGTVIAGPDIVSRGFVYVRESEQLIEEAREKVREALLVCEKKGATEWASIKSHVREALSKYLYEKTKRRPMILPIIMEV